jgi:uncharacterized protein YlzI (FlbEa/FlbD family)
MIVLHRLGHDTEPFHVSADMIVTIEGLPDTTVTLATGARFVVSESPEEVTAAMRDWRVSILSESLRRKRERPQRSTTAVVPLTAVQTAVEGSPGSADHSGG